MLFVASPTDTAASVAVQAALFLAVTAFSGSAPTTPAAVEATDLLPKATDPFTVALVSEPKATVLATVLGDAAVASLARVPIAILSSPSK